MADYYTYRNRKNARRRRRNAVIALAVVLALLCAAGALWFFGMRSRPGTEPPPASATAQPLQATPLQAAPEQATPEQATPEQPLPEGPQRLLPAVDTAAWDTSAPVEQTIDLEYLNTDVRMVALPALGVVPRSHFNTVTFVGDSLTSGLGIYAVGLPNASYVAYKGAGPELIVNNSTAQNAVTGETETPLDALVASQPDYVYIMFGTNSLVRQGNEESFMAYYERMIDVMRENLAPGVIYYIQAIPGVQEDVVNEKPGLDNGRIQTVNNMLANLALRKGCYFVNPREVLNYADGSLVDEYDAGLDGVHMNPTGYRAWTDYLVTHTAWNRRTLYAGENPYYILGS